MDPETALELLQKYVHGETLLRHCKTVGVAMRYFAAGCNREVIKAGAELMGLELNDIIQDCILAMRTRHEEIGC